ncbi:MAG: hypothetical protein HRU38_15215 [Saccharospirillaceae bacterium]|nr:hypothetical protein [Pseudomonadales bacterium]NRB79992.1 hypothetical protein [Saccharospirillaceae bacterium]
MGIEIYSTQNNKKIALGFLQIPGLNEIKISGSTLKVKALFFEIDFSLNLQNILEITFFEVSPLIDTPKKLSLQIPQKNKTYFDSACPPNQGVVCVPNRRTLKLSSCFAGVGCINNNFNIKTMNNRENGLLFDEQKGILFGYKVDKIVTTVCSIFEPTKRHMLIRTPVYL